MKQFKCEEIMCAHCTARINEALNEAGITHNVELDTKVVTVEGSDQMVDEAAELLEDLGFTPQEI